MSLNSTRNSIISPRALRILVVLATLCLSGASGYARSPILLVGVIGIAGLALLLQEPALGLAAMSGLSFTLPLEVGTGSDIALTPPTFLISGITLIWLAEGLRKNSLQLSASRPTLPLLLFVAGGLLSFLAGTAYWDPIVPRADNLVLVQLAQLAIVALSAAIYLVTGELGQRGKWLQRATWLFLILGSVAVLENYIPWLHRVVGWCTPSRAKSGVSWAWLGALAAGQLAFNRRLGLFAKLALVLLLVATTIVVFFWWGEWVSGWVPFVAGVVTVVWLRIWRHSHRAGVIAILVGAAVAIALYPILFMHAGGQQEVDISWGGRLALYRAVISLGNRHPLLGLGPAAYRHYGYTQYLYMPGGAFYQNVYLSSHNNYIDIYAQFGLLGVALFVWFLVELGVVGWRLTDSFDGDFEDGYVHGALGGLVGSLVAMMLVDWFLPYVYNVSFRGFRTSALAWMFLGGLVALQQVAERTKD
jgi:hypothetical protein